LRKRIDNLVLRCVVCGGPLPSSRRAYGDHAGACHKVRTLYRRHIIQLTRCLACLHPATPDEREAFKQWRVSRGDLRGRGNRMGGRTKKANISTAMQVDTQAGDSVACEVSLTTES
jgi:hypothetical protein